MNNNNEINIGNKIRNIREEKQLTINQLAKETGFTPSYISQFERGLTKASVSALQRISTALSINLTDLFNQHEEKKIPSQLLNPVVIKKKNRKKLTYPDGKSTDYLLTGVNGQFEVMYSEIEPGGNSGELFSHDSIEECITVLTGDMEISIENEKYILNDGDTISFSSQIPHGWKNIGSEVLKLIWVVTPPTY